MNKEEHRRSMTVEQGVYHELLPFLQVKIGSGALAYGVVVERKGHKEFFLMDVFVPSGERKQGWAADVIRELTDIAVKEHQVSTMRAHPVNQVTLHIFEKIWGRDAITFYPGLADETEPMDVDFDEAMNSRGLGDYDIVVDLPRTESAES